MTLPAHWGKGLISEAIGTALEFGFGTLGLHRVEAITRPQNAASIRALEKNGFVREGNSRRIFSGKEPTTTRRISGDWRSDQLSGAVTVFRDLPTFSEGTQRNK